MSFLFGKKKDGKREDVLRSNGSGAGGAPSRERGTGAQNSGQQQAFSQGQNAATGNTAPGSRRPMSPTNLSNQQMQNIGPGRMSEDVQSSMRPPQQMNGPPQQQQAPVQGSISQANSALYPWSQRRFAFPPNTQSPFPRYGTAVNATASKDGHVYMMGGLVNGETVKGDLWIFDASEQTARCAPVATQGDMPGPRVGHRSLLVGNAVIVFGGDTKQDVKDELDDALYLLNTSSRIWSKAVPPGPKPAGRYGHSLSILGSKIYVFGGQNDGNFFNDLIAFDLNRLQDSTTQWEFLVPAGGQTEDNIPSPRTNHSMVTWNDQLYLFGGTDGLQWCNDVWTYDPIDNRWSQLECNGFIPTPREGHSAALVNDVMYVFGGRASDGSDCGDLTAFRMATRRWYTFQNMGPAPSPRSGHTMTAYDRQIYVLAGEPSSSPRDPVELGLYYVLDTNKIRYPNDGGQQQAAPGGRSITSRQGYNNNAPGGNSQSREVINRDAAGSPLGRPQAAMQPQQAQYTRPAEAAMQSQPALIASQLAAPTTIQQDIRSATPVRDQRIDQEQPGTISPQRSSPQAMRIPAPAVSQPLENIGRTDSPGMMRAQNNARAQQQQQLYGPTLASAAQISGVKPSANNFQAQLTPAGVVDPSSAVGSLASGGIATERLASNGQNAPPDRVTALSKELEEAKSHNAWYATELSIARKAGYVPSTSAVPLMDETALSTVDEADKPLIEALIAMRAELAEVRGSLDTRTGEAAKLVAEAESQRDAAIKEAVYSKAKLATLHGGESRRGTPLPGQSRDLDISDERSNEAQKKLAAALIIQQELRTKLENLTRNHEAEKQARILAESNADAAHNRLAEVGTTQNHGEIEEVRASLFEIQKLARDEAVRRKDAEASAALLQIDKDDLSAKISELTNRTDSSDSVLLQLREAVRASQEKTSFIETQLQSERQQRELLQRKHAQLKSEHEDRTMEVETLGRKLREAEELSDRYASEAESHRQAVLVGLDRIGSPVDRSEGHETLERRLAVLTKQVDEANAQTARSQHDAESASIKLRRAEERIAGLETYQQRGSLEALNVRKQLQEAVKAAQGLQIQNVELKQQLESHKRDVSALTVKHGALKDLLDERNPNGRLGSPDTVRLKELEQRLEDSQRAYDELRGQYETREVEQEQSYNERLEGLQTDYQSAVEYVKGTEKIIQRLKEELVRQKSMNSKLVTDADQVRTTLRDRSKSEADFESERQSYKRQIDEMKEPMVRAQTQLLDLQAQLHSTQQENERTKSRYRTLEESHQSHEAEVTKLRSENQDLHARVAEAEDKVSLLLDQVESKVDTYRRQSAAFPVLNGTGHTRNLSTGSGFGTFSQDNAGVNGGAMHQGHTRNQTSVGGESNFSSISADRNSLALENLASELETLRSQWEGAHRSRLSGPGGSSARGSGMAVGASSNAAHPDVSLEELEGLGGSDGAGGTGLSGSLANWRKRLDIQEQGLNKDNGASTSGNGASVNNSK